MSKDGKPMRWAKGTKLTHTNLNNAPELLEKLQDRVEQLEGGPRRHIPTMSSVLVWVYAPVIYVGISGTNDWNFGESDQNLRGTDAQGTGKYLGYIMLEPSYDDPRKPVGLPEYNNASGGYNVDPYQYWPDGPMKAVEEGHAVPCVVMNQREFKAPSVAGGLLQGGGVINQYQVYHGVVIGTTPDDANVATSGTGGIGPRLRNVPLVYISDGPHWPCAVRLTTDAPTWAADSQVGVYFGHMMCGGSSPQENVAGSAGFPTSDVSRGLTGPNLNDPLDCKIINAQQYKLLSSMGGSTTYDKVKPIVPSNMIVPGVRVGHVRSNDASLAYQHLVFASFGSVAAYQADVGGGATLATLITAHNDLLAALKNAGLMLRA